MLSRNLAFFERAFHVLNERYFGSALSKSVLTIQSTPKAYGHFTLYEAWEDKAGGYYEINLGAESLNRPLPETIATLLHEMVHQHCFENGIQDVSRSGRYHNKRFKAEAEKRGLIIGYTKSVGHSLTAPAPGLVAFCQSEWNYEVDIHRKGRGAGEQKKSSTRKYTCPGCGQSVRATKEVNIICGDCQVKMMGEDGGENKNGGGQATCAPGFRCGD